MRKDGDPLKVLSTTRDRVAEADDQVEPRGGKERLHKGWVSKGRLNIVLWMASMFRVIVLQLVQRGVFLRYMRFWLSNAFCGVQGHEGEKGKAPGGIGRV